ncbi:4Fe-4S binding protein [Selenihalanaerobacter shriftii]|uniref:4Fe-4S dicluster domain-containing protein n=1 Tax=Selenihalanaerobacter shriftii TaxID=142842 RepID=A0A1T4KRB4_9FIRM|nr:4Fe-4S binding protein [Selenihalanaerobacter shriftii]SJZ44961.1 4Fe-4S dicluster domain-containing protein [Selenihalanaerobacter shriftii]
MKFTQHRKKLQIIGTILMFLLGLGLFNHKIGLIFIAVPIFAVLLSNVVGRFWCGWFCPRGSFLSTIISKVSRNKKIPKFLKSTTFKAIVATVLLTMFMIALLGYNPLIQDESPLVRAGAFMIFVCIVTTVLVAIPLGIIYKPRTWCSFCPVGWLQSAFSKNRKLNIEINDCKECGICAKECPIDIPEDYIGEEEVIDDANCLNCMVCADVCPFDVATPKFD